MMMDTSFAVTNSIYCANQVAERATGTRGDLLKQFAGAVDQPNDCSMAILNQHYIGDGGLTASRQASRQ